MKKEQWDAATFAEHLEVLAKHEDLGVVEYLNKHPDVCEEYRKRTQVPIGAHVQVTKLED